MTVATEVVCCSNRQVLVKRKLVSEDVAANVTKFIAANQTHSPGQAAPAVGNATPSAAAHAASPAQQKRWVPNHALAPKRLLQTRRSCSESLLQPPDPKQFCLAPASIGSALWKQPFQADAGPGSVLQRPACRSLPGDGPSLLSTIKRNLHPKPYPPAFTACRMRSGRGRRRTALGGSCLS